MNEWMAKKLGKTSVCEWAGATAYKANSRSGMQQFF